MEISDTIKKGLEIIPVTRMDEVLAHALVRPLVAIEWPDESAKLAEAAAAKEAAAEGDEFWADRALSTARQYEMQNGATWRRFCLWTSLRCHTFRRY